MGGDQGVDERPYIVAFACASSAPIKHYTKGTAEGERLHAFLSSALHHVGTTHARLVMDTARMFSDATSANALTSVALAYTMHAYANWRPI